MNFATSSSLGTYKSRFRRVTEVKPRYFRLQNKWAVKNGSSNTDFLFQEDLL